MVKFRFLDMERALIGYGGHAREVMYQMGINLPCFVNDNLVCENTLPLSSIDVDQYEFMIAIGDSKNRYELIKKLPKNVKFFTFIHPTALIMDKNIEIGIGSFIGAYSILTTNIEIGSHSILNRGCQIGHDSTIGDYLSMMPNSVISGNCNIGNRVYIGTNASIREKISICDDVTIGLNSGVIRDINISGIYGGVPCKKIK